MGIIKKLNIEDTYVDSNKEQENFRFSEKLKLGQYGENARDIGALIFYKVLDLDSIPSNANIIKAKLHMYQYDMDEDIATVRTYSPCVNFKINEIVWDNKPEFNTNLVEYEKINDVDGWKEFNITNFLQRWLVGAATNYGLCMEVRVDYGAEVYYYSSQYQNPDYRPFIEVEYELPCNPPLNLQPFENKIINLAKTNRFEWDYIPSFKEDTQKEFQIKWSNDNLTWHTIRTSTSDTFVDISGNVFSEGNVYWKIRVKNQQANWSQYSNTIKIVATKKPDIPIITTPNLINVFKPTIKWKDMQTQYSFILEVKKLDNILLWNSGKIISSNNEYAVGIDLENKTSYKIKLKIINKYGLESDWIEKIITTNFQTPNKPKIYILQENEGKGIIIRAVNNVEGIRVIRNEIFRKESGKENYIRIAKINVNSSYTDYAVKSEKTYKYYIRAIGETLGYINSNTQNTSMHIRHNIITDVITNKHIILKYNPQRTRNIKLDSQSFNFAGRKNKVTEFGEYEENSIDFNFSVLDTKVIEDLITLYKSKNILLYRDNRGRKIFCTMNNLRIQDVKYLKYKVSFTLSQEDYSEEVT